MSANSWWRSWHGAPTDPKYLVVALKAGVKAGVVSAVVWALLDYASQHKERGSVMDFDTETYAVYSGFPESEIVAVIQAMTDKGVIKDGRFSNWEKRQPVSEESNERVKKWRAKKQEEIKSNELKQDVTESNTDRLREIDREIEREIESTSPPDLFDAIRCAVEKRGILLSGEADITAIREIIDTGATVEDVVSGLEWKIGNNRGKPVRYISSIVGPTKTATARRLQNGGGHNGDQSLEAQRAWLAGINP